MINGRTGMVASHKPCPDQCPGRERLAGPPGDDRTADGLTLTRDCRFARFVKVPRGEFVNLSCVSTFAYDKSIYLSYVRRGSAAAV